MVDRRAVVFFAAASVLFGGTFVAAKAGLEYFPPLLFVAFRFDVAAVVLAAYAVLTSTRDELVPRSRGDAAGILATGVLSIGLTNALLFVGQQYATSAVASIVFSLNPILTPVFAAALLADERLSVRAATGMLVGLVGVALVVSPDPANLLGGDAVGKAILFAGAVAGALGSVLIRWSDGTLSSTVRTAWGLPFGAALCHLLAWSAGESPGAVVWGPEAVASLAYVGVFAGALAYIAYFGLLDTAGAIRANLVFYVVPVVATLGGWAVLGETISPGAVAGFVTIFAGFAVIGSESVDVRRAVTAAVARLRVTDDRLDVGDDPGGFGSD
ncbi:DMT family transporter [Halostella sp. JP-L12]|uniref:DMT family transporter n=1 Tax=Halostella TaxID=1843185 RepID=UPI000EF78E9E|nr:MULTISPECIES: DMT family transporter [Halostella]NHN49151.1 DMT family transporter [Halostella sp. JP-L12]